MAGHIASQPAIQQTQSFLNAPAHSSWPDSLTIIKRKSFYSVVSFRLCSYFFATSFRLLPLAATLFSAFYPDLCPSILADIVLTRRKRDYFIIQLLSFAWQKSRLRLL